MNAAGHVCPTTVLFYFHFRQNSNSFLVVVRYIQLVSILPFTYSVEWLRHPWRILKRNSKCLQKVLLLRASYLKTISTREVKFKLGSQATSFPIFMLHGEDRHFYVPIQLGLAGKREELHSLGDPSQRSETVYLSITFKFPSKLCIKKNNWNTKYISVLVKIHARPPQDLIACAPEQSAFREQSSIDLSLICLDEN